MSAAVAAAVVAVVLGLSSAAVSAYWAVGGTGLLETVGGEIERQGRRHGTGITLALWVIVGVKLAVALAAPVLTAGPGRFPPWTAGRVPRLLSWIAATVLAIYGGLLTAVGCLVLSGLIPAGEQADRRALTWHAFLWDPWFFYWGLALMSTLWLTRRPVGGGRLRRDQSAQGQVSV
ncbi:conserved membrane hypothetical protein [Frankia sp. Hr75.2]|nr:conserved membrane hypothetical protein [Frankia sp. Hr75.2]